MNHLSYRQRIILLAYLSYSSYASRSVYTENIVNIPDRLLNLQIVWLKICQKYVHDLNCAITWLRPHAFSHASSIFANLQFRLSMTDYPWLFSIIVSFSIYRILNKALWKPYTNIRNLIYIVFSYFTARRIICFYICLFSPF